MGLVYNKVNVFCYTYEHLCQEINNEILVKSIKTLICTCTCMLTQTKENRIYKLS